MTGLRRWATVKRQIHDRWDARCGEVSIDPTEWVEVTGYWANGEQIHSSHRVRVSGVRARGCVHARPWLDWARVGSLASDWITTCRLPNCPAGDVHDVGEDNT